MNPKRVGDFANGMGFLAKTDAVDAYVLALLGARKSAGKSAQLWRRLMGLAPTYSYSKARIHSQMAEFARKNGPGLDVRPGPARTVSDGRLLYAERRRKRPSKPRPALIKTTVVGSGTALSLTAPWMEVWPMGLPTVGA